MRREWHIVAKCHSLPIPTSSAMSSRTRAQLPEGGLLDFYDGGDVPGRDLGVLAHSRHEYFCSRGGKLGMLKKSRGNWSMVETRPAD